MIVSITLIIKIDCRSDTARKFLFSGAEEITIEETQTNLQNITNDEKCKLNTKFVY